MRSTADKLGYILVQLFSTEKQRKMSDSSDYWEDHSIYEEEAVMAALAMRGAHQTREKAKTKNVALSHTGSSQLRCLLFQPGDGDLHTA